MRSAITSVTGRFCQKEIPRSPRELLHIGHKLARQRFVNAELLPLQFELFGADPRVFEHHADRISRRNPEYQEINAQDGKDGDNRRDGFADCKSG
jgi:hypothetical protein